MEDEDAGVLTGVLAVFPETVATRWLQGFFFEYVSGFLETPVPKPFFKRFADRVEELVLEVLKPYVPSVVVLEVPVGLPISPRQKPEMKYLVAVKFC